MNIINISRRSKEGTRKSCQATNFSTRMGLPRVYKRGHIEVVRLFPNCFTQEVDISVERKVTDIDHTLLPLTALIQILETVVNTLKGVD